MSIGEFFRIKKALWSDQAFVLRHYPKNLKFALADLALGFLSLFINPYRVCRKRGEIYGETPISTLKQIANACQLNPSDTWLELGSGRGKSCFWISQFIKCRAIGIDKISYFSRSAATISSLFGLNAKFQMCDMMDVDYQLATCVYIYSTCLSNDELFLLAKKLRSLPPGARIVTISAPLEKWPHISFPVSFPWGTTKAYLHKT